MKVELPKVRISDDRPPKRAKLHKVDAYPLSSPTRLRSALATLFVCL